MWEKVWSKIKQWFSEEIPEEESNAAMQLSMLKQGAIMSVAMTNEAEDDKKDTA